MYFTSRHEAGEKLAEALRSSRRATQPLAVVALSEAAVPVAKPIADALHAPLSMLVSRPVTLPAMTSDPIGSMSQDGSFVLSDDYPPGEAAELQEEFHGYLEEEKIRQLHLLHQLMGDAGIVSSTALRGHTVIAVSDGLKGPSPLEAMAMFLKPIRISGLIAAVPVASVQAVDKMHIMFDELHCLHVTENYLDTDHYYDNEAPPSHEEAQAILRDAK